MGAAKQIDPQSPTAATNGAWDRYDRALETLTCRALGEPYNFYRIDAEIHQAMFGQGVFGKLLQECREQFRKSNRYNVFTVAAATNLAPETVSEFSRRDSEIDLVYAFEMFRDIYGQFVEIRIADFVSGWVGQNKTSEEIKIEAEKMRRELGVSPRATGSDGKEEFESELLAALDGKVFQYPVKPHLERMRRAVQHYEPGDYVIVAALSGVGKTYYALNTIYYNALQGVPCCCINLENTPKNIQKRMWQLHGGVKFRRDMRGSDEQGTEALRVWEEVKRMPFKSCNPGPTLPAILSTIRHEYNERGIQLVVIDYAQLINIPGYRGGRNYELGEISAAFRALSLELNIVVMVLAQLKQEVSRSGDRRGGLYDIKDCANFAQDATYVHSLYRPFYHEVYENDQGIPYDENYADIRTVKGRETGKMEAQCVFDEIKGFQDNVDSPAPTATQFPATTYNQPAESAIRAARDAEFEDMPF